MLSPPDVYLTVTSGFCSLKPSITAWKDSCSAPVQTPITEIEPETLSAVVVLGGRRPAAFVVVAAARPDEEQEGEHQSEESQALALHACSFRSVVDAESRLRVEEMEGARVDRDLDRLALARLRARAEAADHRRPASPLLRRRRHLARCRRPSASSRTSSVTAGVASIVKWTMTSEPSASVSCDLAARARGRPGVGCERGVLEILGPDAEDHRLARRSSSAPGARDSVSSPSAICWLPATAVRPPFAALERRLDEVHRGAADEAADEEVERAGRRAPAARRPAAARPCASRRRGRPSSSPRPGRA